MPYSTLVGDYMKASGSAGLTPTDLSALLYEAPPGEEEGTEGQDQGSQDGAEEGEGGPS